MKLPIAILIIIVAAIATFFAFEFRSQSNIDEPSELPQSEERHLDKYSFDALSKKKFDPSEIKLGERLTEDGDIESRIFFFSDSNKRVSGQINIPEGSGPFPVVLMLRGYVDKEIYRTGVGTERAAQVFAENGFITIAPDFLGYGLSDEGPADSMEDRFQTYTTTLTLLSSIDNLNVAFAQENIDARADSGKVGIWGHSNGGQIAISVLEITGSKIPTVLWAPVTKPFPYSVLYYTDEFDDRGKYLRSVIAEFEENYDVENYSIENFFDKINAPIQLHQGSLDDAVPKVWSDEFVEILRDKQKEIDYRVYNGADHNLLPIGWDIAVAESVQFFKDNFENK